ncbi:MAG: hypothetical protein V4659_06095 [Pseudomonadota bacterium]
MTATQRAIVLGTATAGTLDLMSAFVFGGMAGRTAPQILAGVATGPFPAIGAGLDASAVGAAVHYAIMAVMVGAFVLAARGRPALLRQPIAAGVAYGVLLYLIMYWIVLPLRFPAVWPRSDAWTVGNALFSHCLCVGVPIALIARAQLQRRR